MPIIEKLKKVLSIEFKVSEIYEIQEGGLVSVKALNDCVFYYDGLEYLYTDFDYQFVIYFSHESSVTVGGKKLISAIHLLWPEYKNHIWTTPFYK